MAVDQEGIKVTEVLLVPMISWGQLSFNGQGVICMTLHHPRHGQIHSIVDPEVARQYAEWILGVLPTPKQDA